MAKPRLTKAATRAIEGVLRTVRRRPDTFNMNTWMHHDERVKGEEPLCGTVACFAGHLVLQATSKVRDSSYTPIRDLPAVVQKRVRPCDIFNREQYDGDGNLESIPTVDIQEAAAAILGLKDYQGEKLFFTRHWPKAFRKRYARPGSYQPIQTSAERREARVKTFVARVRHWMRTGE